MKTTEPNALLTEYATIIISEEDSVERYCYQGFRLLHVIEGGQAFVERGGQYDPQTGRNAPPDRHVVTRPLFVMGKHENAVIDEMRAHNSRIEDELKQLRALNEQTLRDKSNAVAAERRTAELLARAQDERATAVTRATDLDTRVRKMERDLARVRQHIGSKLFDEATGAEKS